MAGAGFGLPTRLLNAPSGPSSLPVPNSTAVLSVPQAPSFADFSFKSIGQPPRLLNRFTETRPIQMQDSADDDNVSTFSDSDQRLQSADQGAAPRTRPSLWQALTEETGIIPNHSANDGLAAQTPTLSSPHFPIIQLKENLSNHLSGVSNGNVAQTDSPVSSSPLLSTSAHANSAAQHCMLQVPTTTDTRRAHQNTGPSLGVMNHPSAGPGPSGSTDYVMEDVQIPSQPSAPLISRKYEALRQIQSRLQASIPSHNQPNLASAKLLTNSAQQKVVAVHTDARRLYNFTQEVLQAAQKGHEAASALLKAAEEAKGIVDGAKSEVERISAAYTEQQCQADQNEVGQLLQSLGDWILGQETDEAAMRERRARQLRLKKQRSELMQPPPQPVTIFSSAATPQTTAPAPLPRQPLFYSPTPEVDINVKVEPPSSLHNSPVPTNLALDPSQRQTELRRMLKSKCHLPEEAQTPSLVENVQLQRCHQEEEIKMQLDEERKEEDRKQEEKRKEEERRRQEEQKMEERRALARQSKEREREEMERTARENAKERLLEEERARDEEERNKKIHEMMEAMRKVRAEASKKTVEEDASRKVQEDDAKRRAQEEEVKKKLEQEEEVRKKAVEAQQKRLALLRQQQEEELQATLAQEAEQRRAKEKAEESRKLEEERARTRAEQAREEKLQEQNKRRQQIQAEKDKSMADRAQQILAQRGHRAQSSLDATSEMSLDSSPVAPKVAVLKKPPAPHSGTSQSTSTMHIPLASPLAPQVPLTNGMPTQSLASKQFVKGLISNDISSDLGESSRAQTSLIRNGQGLTTTSKPSTPVARLPSLPPVACLSQPSQSTSPTASQTVPSSQQPTLSVYRLSGDSGNVPYKENPGLSPRAQVANIRHVVSVLNLPPLNFSPVKSELSQNDSVLLYPPSSDGNPSTQITEPVVQGVHRRSSSTQLPFIPSTASVILPGNSLPVQPSHDPPASTRALPLQPQQLVRSVEPILGQIQAPVPPLSAPGVELSKPKLDCPVNEPSSQVQQRLSPSHPLQADSRSRSQSPFRMGPDTFILPPIINTPPDDGADNGRPPITGPSYRRNNRIETSISGHMRQWDHYSPSPRTRSPPRQADTYRPNYSERSRSPPLQAGRKRSRDVTPPPGPPYIRDYRDYVDDRRGAPRRRSSRSPPPPPPTRGPRRTPSRSPSPGCSQSRPPLASRLAPGNNDDGYRPVTPPRDWEREPRLLNRFTDARDLPLSHSHPTRGGGRGRGKRGRGGGGPPPSGIPHASLEQRISSGSTLITRIEDTRRI